MGCERYQPQLIERDMFVFGTMVNVSVWHDHKTEAEKALTAIETHFNNMHHQWHAWKPGRLQEINQALRSEGSIPITDAEEQFFRQAQDLSLRSQHTFNPALGELIHLWGFHTDEYPIQEPPPNEQAVMQVVAFDANMADLTIENGLLTTSNHRVWMDFGGIAKGLAVDQAIDILHDHGIHNAIVNAGGDLRSMGRKAQRPWRIAIQIPDSNEILGTLEVQSDEAIFTSGNYYRYKQFNGERYAHIIDGRTGQPVIGIRSATVIAEEGVVADAAATALIVAGPQNWAKIAARMNIRQALVIDQDNNCQASVDMLHRLNNPTLICTIVHEHE